MYVDSLLAAEAGEGGVTADLGDVEDGAGGERFALHRVDAQGEPDDGPVERLVELQPAHDAGGAADRFHRFQLRGDDYVSSWGAHRLAALRGDHARLHAPFGDRPGEALTDAFGQVETLTLLLGQRANLSKKRAKEVFG